MKKMGIVLSFLLVPLMVLAPMAATLADAHGSGSGSGAGASGGAAAGAGASGAPAGGGGASAGGAGAAAGAPAGAAAGTGDATGTSGASVGTSPSSGSTPSLGVWPVTDRRVINESNGVAPSASIATTGDFVGRHTMTGTVTKVDHDKGFFRLKTSEGTLDLHAPPSVLAGVQKGDRMNVEIAVQPVR
jgi:hypothetical protein